MAGPRYLGINNVIDPTEGARRALNEAGSIYRDFDEQTRRNEDRQRVIAEHDRVNQERKTLAGYNPSIGQDFFGIDADTQNHIRQNEAQILKRNAELLASKDPSARSEADLQAEFLTKRAQLADRDTVFRDVFSELVSQNVSDENAQRRATIAASGYGSTRDLLASEQASVDAFNKRNIELAKIQAGYDKSDATNQTNLIRSMISAQGRAAGRSTSGTGSSTGSKSSTGSVNHAFPTLEERSKLLENSMDLADGGLSWVAGSDGKKAVNSLTRAIDLMATDVDKANEALYEEALEKGLDLSKVQYLQMPSWDVVQREFSRTFRNGADDRFAFNTPEDAKVSFLEPLQRRLDREQRRTLGNPAQNASGLNFNISNLDLNAQATRSAVLQQPAVARQLTDINRAKVAQVYSEYQLANPQMRPTANTSTSSTQASIRSATPERATRNVPVPPPSVTSTLGTSNEVGNSSTVEETTPSDAEVMEERIRQRRATQLPDIRGLDSSTSSIVQSVFNEYTADASPARRKELENIIEQLDVPERFNAVLQNRREGIQESETARRRQRELFSQYQDLLNQQNTTSLKNWFRSTGEGTRANTEESINRRALEQFTSRYPEIVREYRR